MPNEFEMLLTAEQTGTFAASGLWRNRLLVDSLDDAVAASPARTATIDAHGFHSYADLHRDVADAAAALIDAGVESGDTVSIQLPNRYEWIVIHLAAIRVGAVTNPLIPIYRDREIGYMAAKARTKVLFVPGTFRNFDYPAMVDRLRPDLPELARTIVVGEADGLRDGFTSWDGFMAAGRSRGATAEELAARRPDPNDLALLMFTSGTTGRPKGAMHTHNTVGAGSLPWPDRLGMGPETVVHMASTFGHLTGYLFGVSLPLMLGGTGVFQEVWDAAEFVELVERHGINHTSGATPFLHDLLSAPNIAEHDLGSLRHFCCMGAPIPRSMVLGAKEKIPALNVFGGWGQTECCLVTMGHPSDPAAKIADSDGRPLHGMELRIMDVDGAEAPPNTEGRIQVRGAFLFQGYAGQLDKTLEEFDGDWFDTGDLGTKDDDGYVRLSGRTKDVIIRGGENIPVAYVENILYEHPRIEAVAVVAVPHPRLQEIAGAVVTVSGDEPFTLADLKAFLEAKGVAKPYWPEILEVTGELPRTPSGKIQKFVLRERLSAARNADKTATATPAETTGVNA